jgi:hypothetical protein
MGWHWNSLQGLELRKEHIELKLADVV